MKYFIIDYDVLCKKQDSGICQVGKLLVFILFFQPFAFHADYMVMINSFEAIALFLLALIAYLYIYKKCDSSYSIFITIFSYSVLYSVILGAIATPLAVLFHPSEFLKKIHLFINAHVINLLLTYGFAIYLLVKDKKEPRRSTDCGD